MIEFRILGSVDLEGAAGEALRPVLAQPKRVALLAYLSVASPRGFHRREKLLGLFWPDSDAEHARGSLRNSLYFLRRYLGDGVIVSRGEEEVRLAAETVLCDAVAFEKALERGDPEKAIELYRGHLLDGFHVSGLPEFERWVESERQRLFDACAGALEKLAGEAEAAREYRRAVDWWKRAISHDPYNSRYALRLIKALAAAGDRGNALQFAEEHRRRLSEELGMEPDPELLALAESLQSAAGLEHQALGQVAPTAAGAGTEASADAPRRWLYRRGWQWIGGLAVAVAIAAAVTWYVGWGGSSPVTVNKSIAVLPCENISPNAEDAYLAEGLYEEILVKLSEISSLTSIGRTSVEWYRDHPHPLSEMAAELGVGYVGECSVRKGADQDRIRLTFQLLDARTGAHVWAEEYDRDLADIFAIQSDVARQIATVLGASLTAEEKEEIEARPTANQEAYEYYLRAQEFASGRRNYGFGPESGDRIWLELLEKATELDSSFALAYAKASGVHSGMYWFFYDHSEERLRLAKRAVDRALALDPDLPEAHHALGLYYYWGLLDYERALQEMGIALSKQPRNAKILEHMGVVERRRGNLHVALDYFEKVAELEPRRIPTIYNMAETHGRLLRNHAEAQRLLDRVLALAPDFNRAYGLKAWNYIIWEGNTSAARAVLEAAAARGLESVDDPFIGYRWVLVDLLDGDYEAALARLSRGSSIAFSTQFHYLPKSLLAAQVLDLMGEPELARQRYDSAAALLEVMIQEAPDDARLYGALGMAYAGLGRVEEAIGAGERGVDLLPMSKEPWRGAYRIEELARILTMTGRYDAAIDRIEFLLSVPGDMSVRRLRLDPTWDPLREQPRFQTLLEKYE